MSAAEVYYAQSLACTLGNHHLCPSADVHGNPCPCKCHVTTHAGMPVRTRTTDHRA